VPPFHSYQTRNLFASESFPNACNDKVIMREFSWKTIIIIIIIIIVMTREK
jgi:hypothetical protein